MKPRHTSLIVVLTVLMVLATACGNQGGGEAFVELQIQRFNDK